MSQIMPPMCKVRCRLPEGKPVDIGATMSAQWQKLALDARVRGQPIAIGVGSRGVAEIVSITRYLVEVQGGQIWFESELRKGTTFHFTVPVAATRVF